MVMEHRISTSLLDPIIAAATASTTEICGLLLGRNAAVTAAIACRNVAADPHRRFEIDPAALIAAYRQARTGGDAVIGHYHSHPGGLPVPSACDAAAAAADGAIWLIVGGGGWRAWRAVADGAVQGRFDPLPLVVAPPCAAESAPPEGHG